LSVRERILRQISSPNAEAEEYFRFSINSINSINRSKLRRELGQFAESVNHSIESCTDRAPSSEPAKRARAKESGKGLRQIELIRRQYLGGSQRTGRRYGRIAGKLGVKQRFGSTGNWNYVCRTLGGSRRENKHG